MRATIVDAHHNGLIVFQVGDLHPRAERQLAMGGGQGVLVERFAAGGAVGNAVSQMAMMAGDNGAPARDVVDLRFHVGGKPHTVQSSRETAMQLAQALRELSRGA